MQQLRAAGFIHHDSLQITPVAGFEMRGEIACLGDIIIEVKKTFEIVEGGPDPSIRTILYSYNAWVRNHETFLRYDNQHPRKGHPDNHHKHEQDWQTGRPLGAKAIWVGEDRWPLLSEFVEEVAEWYYAHCDELPYPNKVADIGIWGPNQERDGHGD